MEEIEREEHEALLRAQEALDNGTREFERLARMDRFKLLDELERMKLPDLRRILLTRVLLEQQRRADLPGTEPSGQAPNGH